MSNYTKTTDFAAKDSLPTGDAGKIIRGAEFGTEFDNIATAIATKADTAGPTLTGTTTFDTLSDGTIAVTAFVDEDDMSSDSATMLPTQQSVKAYVDSQTTAQDLDFEADTGGPLSIDLDSETLTLTGGTGVDTSGAGNAVTFAIDSTVATLTDTQTLTNKTLTSADIDTPDIDGGTIDGTVIGGTTAAAVSATTVSATGNITVDGTVDGRDVATDGTKLDTVETNADVTDTTNVTAAGALMDSEVTNLAQVKAFDSADYATAAQGATADAALPKTGGAMTGAITTNSTFDGRDVATDGTKLDGIEALADVTDTTNVTAAGALMDSELTDLTAVKSLDQGVATTDSPTFAGLTTTADVSFGDNDKAIFGASSDLEIYHDGSHSYVSDQGTGRLVLNSSGGGVRIEKSPTENMAIFTPDGNCELFYDNSLKLATTSTGIDVTGRAVVDGLTSSASIVGTSNSNSLGGTTFTSAISTVGLSSTAAITSTSNSNSLGGTSFTSSIDVTGTVTADGLTLDAGVYKINNTSVGSGSDKWIGSDGGAGVFINSGASGNFNVYNNNAVARLGVNGSTGDISFYEDTGTTAKLFWDASAESLGIGTSSPASGLELEGVGNATNVTLDNTTASTGRSYSIRSGNTGNLDFYDNDATAARVTINSSGNAGIGTSSPSRKVSLADSVNGYNLELQQTSAYNSGNQSGIVFSAPYNIGGSVTDLASIRGGKENATDGDFGGKLAFYTRANGGSDTERMRIDSSGNVLVNTTAIPTGLGASNTKLILSNFEDAPEFVAYNSDNAVELGDKIGAYLFGNDDNNATEDHFAGIWAKSAGSTGAMDIHFAAGNSNYEDDSPHMTLDSDGNVGIGTSSIDNKVNIQESALAGRDASNGNTTLTLEHATDTGIQFFSATQTQLRFGDAASTAAGSIIFEHATNKLRLNTDSLFTVATGGTEAMRIDSSGNVGIGVTSADSKLEVNGTVNINGIYHTEATQTFLTASTANDLVSVAFGSAQIGVYVKIKYRSTKNDGGVISHVAGEELFIFRSDSTSPAVATTSTNTGSSFLTFTTAQDTGNNKLTVKVNPGAAANFADITYTLEVIPRNVGTTPTITHL